ncbi:ABC transporter permease subunit [Agromyces seonyuensis]|uniref:ABC transporter permease subunit n=1 Tax=Agromyces seonyuensis TaxID=2662446 RepID=A0A6I4NRF0_9MICO|nr:ABC transporter permease subunit [Agromyces seonyuensis]MWB97006.1 ABC transporter permease subunit [Agromyces seonyuensis]
MSTRRRVLALARKDWHELARNPQAIAPLIVVPLLLVVLLPAGVILFGANPALTSTVTGLQSFLDHLPEGMLPAGLDPSQTIVYAVVVYFLAPLFLVIPVMVASVTAASSFVGEKERRTVEGLLYTPLTDRELVFGKVLAAMLPAVGIAWASFLVYAVLVNVLGGPLLGGIFFPTWTWAIIVVLLVPLVAFLATALIVMVSGRATTMQGAQGIAVLVVLPVVAIVVGQATGLLLFDVGIALAAAAVLALLDLAVFGFVVRSVSRERIVTRL